MAVCVNINFSNILICFIIRFVSVVVFFRSYVLVPILYLMALSVLFEHEPVGFVKCRKWFWDVMSSFPAQGYFVFGALKIMWGAADAHQSISKLIVL